MKNIKTLNVGKNRGKSRVWIENGPLTAYGWTRGTRYNVIPLEAIDELSQDSDNVGAILLERDDDEGKRKVAGTDTRPIIDLCNNQVAEWTNGAPKVSIRFNEDNILIIPIH